MQSTNLAAIAAGLQKIMVAHPTIASEIQPFVRDLAALRGPTLAVYMEGGLIQEIRRLNDAPFLLYVHDHDIEGADDNVSAFAWSDGTPDRAIISQYDRDNTNERGEGPYWESLRNPVPVDPQD